MTKKDYIKISDAFSLVKKGYGPVLDRDESCVFYDCVNAIADMLQNDNPAFDRNKFIEYINK